MSPMIVVDGNAIDGFTFYGPFESETSAITFANTDLRMSGHWQISPIVVISKKQIEMRSCLYDAWTSYLKIRASLRDDYTVTQSAVKRLSNYKYDLQSDLKTESVNADLKLRRAIEKNIDCVNDILNKRMRMYCVMKDISTKAQIFWESKVRQLFRDVSIIYKHNDDRRDCELSNGEVYKGDQFFPWETPTSQD